MIPSMNGMNLSLVARHCVVAICFASTMLLSRGQSQCDLLLKKQLLDQPKPLNLSESAAVDSFTARATQVHDMRAATDLAAAYLDHLDKGGRASIQESEAVLGHLRDLSALGLDQPDWIRQKRLSSYPSIVGFYEDSGGTVLYLKGEQRAHAVSISPSGRVTFLDQRTAVDGYRAYCREQVHSKSTSNMALFDLMHLQDGTHQLVFANSTISLSGEEFAALNAGKRLPPRHPLSLELASDDGRPKVLFSDPYMQKPGAAMKETDTLVFGLQKAYPEIPIIRDPYSTRTDQLVGKLNNFLVSGPKDITAIVAEDSFRPRPKDFHVITDLEEQLEEAHIKVVKYHGGAQLAPVGTNRGLIVITGHSDEQLAAFVRTLGGAGAFQGNYVMFNSCETPLTRQLVTEINTRYGAVATMAHQGKVMVNDLDSFLVDFSKRISGDKPVRFRDLVLQSLHENGLNGLWTICDSRPEPSPNAGDLA